MTALLVAALLMAPPGSVATFERLKSLQGNWRSSDGRVLSVRLTASGGAVVASLAGADKSLTSVTVFRLDGDELVGLHDGLSHALFRPIVATERLIKLAARPEGPRPHVVAIAYALKSPDSLTLTITTRTAGRDADEAIDFEREYLETLK